MPGWIVSGSDTQRAFAADPANDRYKVLLQRGSMSTGLWAVREVDTQTPHTQDEVYIIVSGTGTFNNGGERAPFKSGDVIFVKAGVEHRFESLTSDFQTWVVFWGPEGGET